MKIRYALGILALAASLIPAAANAATTGSAQGSISVSATVSAVCTIATNPLLFGAYDPVVNNNSSDLPQTADLSITCSKGSSPLVGVGSSASAACSSNTNCQTSGSGTMKINTTDTSGLNYTYSLALATGASTTLGINNPEHYTLSGNVAAGQDVPNGSYSDTLVAVVEF